MAIVLADTACVDPRAELADDVEIGPYCVVGPNVRIGAGTRLMNNVTVSGHTVIGMHNVFHPFAVIGGEPQDYSYRGSPTRVLIGDRNVFREYVTVNRATEKEDGTTRIGSNCYFMATSHIAHDCKLGDHITIANCTMLAGHVHIQSYASISGGVAIHHFCTIGGYSFIGGQSRIVHDVPPYMLVDGNPCKIRCINIVGLRRRGISKQGIESLHEAHRLLYRAKMNVNEARKLLDSRGSITAEVKHLLDFVDDQHLGKHGRARERFRDTAGAPASVEADEG
jgi:UDP-N-acetylglucosamine acyltransferase